MATPFGSRKPAAVEARKKSVVKSVAPAGAKRAGAKVVPQAHGGALRPFQRGGDPRSGRGPKKGAPNAGRPPSWIHELVDEGLKNGAIHQLVATAQGKPVQRVQLPDGSETEVVVSAAPKDQIMATRTLLEVKRLIGARVEVANVGDKPFIVILRPE